MPSTAIIFLNFPSTFTQRGRAFCKNKNVYIYCATANVYMSTAAHPLPNKPPSPVSFSLFLSVRLTMNVRSYCVCAHVLASTSDTQKM